jgi:hypothetical protein
MGPIPPPQLANRSRGSAPLIGKARRVVARDGRHVMAEALKVGNEAKVGALIEEEFHPTFARFPGGFAAMIAAVNGMDNGKWPSSRARGDRN